MKKVLKYFILIIFLLALFGCTKIPKQVRNDGQSNGHPELVSGSLPTSLDDFDGKNIGVLQGTIHDKIAEERWQNAKIFYYKDTSDMILALERGTIDGYVSVEPSIRCLMNERDDIEMFGEMLSKAEYAYIFAKNAHGESLQKQMNEFLSKLRASGTLLEIRDLWTGKDESKKNVEIPTSGKNGSLKFATALNDIPFAYIKDGKPAGYDVDIAARFCAEYGYALEIVDMDFAALLAGVTAGKYDFGADGIAVTDERKEAMLFSDANYDGGNVLVVKKNDVEVGNAPSKITLSDFNSANKKIGIQTGTTYDALVAERFPKAQPSFYNNYADLTLALTQGMIDGFVADESVAITLAAQNSKITLFPEMVYKDEYAFIFGKDEKGRAFQKQMNGFLEKISNDGTLEKIKNVWLGTDESKQVIEMPNGGANGTLVMATEATYKPFVYIKNGKVVGYDIDVASRFCREYGYALKVANVDFTAIVPGVASGKYDFASGGISITPERAESVLFSAPNYIGGAVMVVKKDFAAFQTSASGNEIAIQNGSFASTKGSFFSSVASSFEKTFIRESRWKLILKGIGTTMLISFFAAIFGTALGFGVCMVRRSKNKIASGAAIVYIRVLQGTPIVVFLMILYYIVFGKSSVPAVWVAIIGFAMNFAAYVSEMMRTGIDAVDNGQIEAALAIGFNKFQTFTKIVMPQAARHFLPVYKGELISLVKSTSIVGYIAIQDLTKMSDIIRSRTYEAFFPLIATAIIYFALAYLLTLVLNFIMKKIEPKRGSKKAFGIILGGLYEN